MRIAFLQEDPFVRVGVLAVANYLRRHGYECKAFIANAHGDFLEEVRRFDPAVAGYYVTSAQKNWTLHAAGRVRREMPGVFQIAGGPHPTFYPDYLLEGELDAVCQGEGEDSLLALCEALKDGKLPADTRNLHVKAEGARLPMPGLRPLMKTEELDALPFGDFEIYRHYPALVSYYRHMYPIIASRGCPLKCTFCYNDGYMKMYSGLGRSVRWRSPGNVVEEILMLREKYGLRRLVFEDDAFMLSKGWFQEFADLYATRVRLPFTTQSIANSVTAENVALLKKMGCGNIRVGLETGSEELRTQLLRKTVRDKDLKESARLIKGAGIKLQTYNMIGLPGETLEDSLKTYRFNREIGTDCAHCSILKPYPGTEVMSGYLAWYGGSVDEVSGETYFEDPHGRLKPEMRNLHRLMQLGVTLKLPETWMRRMIALPLDKLYQALFEVVYGLSVKRANGIPWGPFVRMAWFSRKFVRRTPVPGPQAPLPSSLAYGEPVAATGT